MGLHTWFYKDKTLYLERISIYDKIDDHEKGEIYLNDEELDKLWKRANEMEGVNCADYHDAFRTNKREEGSTEYTLDVIYSKEECDKWLIDNVTLVSNLDKDYLDKFWKEFPNGVIDFG